MQNSSCPPLTQSYPIAPDARRTGFAIQQLKRSGDRWVHARFWFYTDNQKWGLFTDGSRPMCRGLACTGACLYVETPGGPDDIFHSNESVKYKLVILRCLACEATNSACDGRSPCDVCYRDAVDCFPYSEMVDDNLVWSRWTAMPHAAIDLLNHERFSEEIVHEDVQDRDSGFQYPEAVFPSEPCQTSVLTEYQSSFMYQPHSDMSNLIDPLFQPTPINSSPFGFTNSGTSYSPDNAQGANLAFNSTCFQQRDSMDPQVSVVPHERARTRRAPKGKRADRNKRPKSTTSVVSESGGPNRPSSRRKQPLMGENIDHFQHQLQTPTPELDPSAPSLCSIIDLDQGLMNFDYTRQDPFTTYEKEHITGENRKGPLEQANLILSPPTESSFSTRCLSPVTPQSATSRYSAHKTTFIGRSKSPSATTNQSTLSASPGTRTGGGRYDGATYDAPPPSTALPLRNCNLTAVEILTYLPKHAFSHPDICMRLVDNGWGDSTMADYITITRGRLHLKNSVGKSITSIGKAKYPYFRAVKREDLALLSPDYGTVPASGAGSNYAAMGADAASAERLKTKTKTKSEWCVKLHRKINRPPQHTLSTAGFAPGRTSIPMWELATGVLPDKHPKGFDALDLTRSVQFAIQTRKDREWLFPDDWDEVLGLLGGPLMVTREHFDAPAVARWRGVRAGLSDAQLFKKPGEKKGRRDDD